MDATRWRDRCCCRHFRGAHDGGPSGWASSRRNHRRRAGDAWPRPAVSRCSALRMEAHRYAVARETTRRPLSSSASTRMSPTGHPGKSSESPGRVVRIRLLSRRYPLYLVVAITPYGPTNAPERRLSARRGVAESPLSGGYRDAGHGTTRRRQSGSRGRLFDGVAGTAPRARRHEHSRRRTAAALRDPEQDAATRCLARGVLRSKRSGGHSLVDRQLARHADVRGRRGDHRRSPHEGCRNVRRLPRNGAAGQRRLSFLPGRIDRRARAAGAGRVLVEAAAGVHSRARPARTSYRVPPRPARSILARTRQRYS